MSIFVPHTELSQFVLEALANRIRSGVSLGWLACLTISLAPSICAQEQVDVAVVVEGAVVDGAVVFGAVEPAVQNDPQLWLLSSYARVNSALARRACELTEAEERQLIET